MIGAMPAGLFGMKGIVAGDGQGTMPSEAFQWGAGGQRLTPDDIAAQRQLAQEQMAAGMDYSPVGHWTQGLARVAQALVGKSSLSKLDKASAANSAESAAALESLGTGGTEQSIAAILANPNLGQGVRDVAKLKWQDTHRAPVAPPQPSEFERTLLASGVQQGTPQWTQANQARLQNYTDPTINIPLPGGRVYVGPRSGFAAATGGGGSASTGPVGGMQPPATLPPDFDFDQGGPASQAPATFR